MLKGDKRTINGWVMYDWANSVYSLTITSAIFPMFYVAATREYGVQNVIDRYGAHPDTLYPWALSAGFLVVALIAPLLSGIADHTGRKLTFLKLFCYTGAAACAGLFFFDVDHLWVGLGMVMLACVGFSGSLIFYDAFLPEIAEPKDHDRISARGYTMGYIGSVLLLVVNLAMVMRPALFGLPEGSALPARVSFLTVAVWWVGFAQIPFARLPRNPYHRKASGAVVLNGYRELRKVWRELRATRRLKRFLLAFFMLNMGIQTVMYLAVNYAKAEIVEVGPDGVIGPITDTSLIVSILLIQLVAAVGALLFVRLSKRFGNVRALMIGAVVWVVLCGFAYTIHQAQEFYVLAAGVGLVMGGSQAISRSTYAKFLPETIDHASYFSFYDVSYYIGTVVGTFIYGLVFGLTGDLRNTVLVIGGFFLVGLALLALVPREEVALEASPRV